MGMVARRVSASGLIFWLNRLVAAGLPRSIFLGRFNGAMAQCVAPSFHSQRAARSAVLFSVCGVSSSGMVLRMIALPETPCTVGACGWVQGGGRFEKGGAA